MPQASQGDKKEGRKDNAGIISIRGEGGVVVVVAIVVVGVVGVVGV